MDSIITSLLDNLNDLLVRETKSLFGLHDEIRSLSQELQRISVMLHDLEWGWGSSSKGDNHDVLAEQIRDLVYETEDLIDTYMAQDESFFAKLKLRVFQFRNPNSVANKIQKIRRNFREIYESLENQLGNCFQFGESSLKVWSSSRARSYSIEEATATKEAALIVEQLTGQQPAGVGVISIIGMGGVGKTTLARNVYNNPLVGNHFDFRSWVSVSRNYEVRNLFQCITKSGCVLTDDELMKTDEEKLTMSLLTHLRSRKFLIVLDDVWSADIWKDFKGIISSSLQGSKIIVTTRNHQVAPSSNLSIGCHYLELMNQSESWQIISKKVFPRGNCPSELEDLGMQIAKKCRGIPLAMTILPGILTDVNDKHRWWPKILSRVSSFAAEDRQHCMDLLTFSYDYLPYHLKSCFLYFGVFPEDFEIPTRQLIRMWLAEGFVEKKDGESMEATAEEYLEELIDRNLVQVAKLRFDGGVKTCRIHDLLHDLCISLGKKVNFVEVCRDVYPLSLVNSRRIAIHSNPLHYLSSIPSTLGIRSLLCFHQNNSQLSSIHWKSFYKSFTPLRVLDLWDIPLESIPTQVGSLIHLRYLRLKSYTTVSLPPIICNLRNLQTLEIKAPKIDRPEIAIWKMRQLRHLNFHGQLVLPTPPTATLALSELQTLASISPDSCTDLVLLRCPSLLKLSIYGDLDTHMSKVFKNLSSLKKLRTLNLERDRRTQPVGNLHDWSDIPVNITKLTISETQLSINPMPGLGMLSNLQSLKLTNSAYVGDVLASSCGDFPQLKVLKLINLGIRKWDLPTGSMAGLRNVVISRCTNLEGLPSALKDISTLQKLELWWPNALVVNDSRETQKYVGTNLLKLTIYHF